MSFIKKILSALFPFFKGKEEFVCPPHESIINLSDECLARLTGCGTSKGQEQVKEEEVIEEKVEETVTEEEQQKEPCKSKKRILEEKRKLCDEEWMVKLKCFDDCHSQLNGITMQTFDALLKQALESIGTVRQLTCLPDTVIACMKKYPNCSIRCKQISDQYIDCIDTYRINIYKEFIECELKQKRKEEQQVAEEVFNTTN